MTIRQLIVGLIFIYACSSFLSCRTSKELRNVTIRSLSEVIDSLTTQHIPYQFFSAKARIKFNGEESKVGGRTNIRMIRDSIIWMNFKKLSIEGARTLIRPDSCWVLYRFGDYYESGQTTDFINYYKLILNFKDLQNLIVGNFPHPLEEEVMNYDQGTYYKISFLYKGDNYEYLINEDFTIFRILIRDKFDREIMATLKDYEKNNVATNKEIVINIPGEGISKISMKLSSVEIDVPKKISFEIPDHYTRLP